MGERMRKQVLILCVIILVGLASCGKKAEEPAYPVVTETVNGIKVLTNPDYPCDGRVNYNLVEEVSIGEETGPEEYLLNRPFDLKIDDRGYFYIYDARDCHILVYDDSGKYVRTIGGKGKGPGEFESLVYFDFLSDGRLFAHNGMNQRISIFDKEGNPLRDFRLEGFYSGVLIDSSDRVYLQKSSQKKEVEPTSEFQEIQMITGVYSMDSDGQNINHLVDIEVETAKIKAMEGGTLWVGGSIDERFVWALNPMGKLYIGFSKTYQISVLSEDGTVEFRFGREYTPVANEEHEENLRVPEFHSAFNPNILIDGEGNCWIRQFTPADFEGYLYDIFDSEGIFIKQAVLSYPIYMFKDGKAYSLLRSEFEYPMVKRFRLEGMD
jgi:hypothetical protein